MGTERIGEIENEKERIMDRERDSTSKKAREIETWTRTVPSFDMIMIKYL